MADYDDAVSPVGEDERPSRARGRASGPIGRLWGWFAAQPAQTKVIILGVIVVLGVVAYMAIKGKSTAQAETDSEDKPGKFFPLGQMGPGANGPTGIASAPTPGSILGTPVTSGDTSNASSYPPPTASTSPNPVSTLSGPTGIATQPAQAQSQIAQAAAYRPPVTPTITPLSASTVVARVNLPAGSTPPRNVRPTVITKVPTERGTNISF
jgi:hypothetical protein